MDIQEHIIFLTYENDLFLCKYKLISMKFHSGAVKTLAIPTMKRNMPFLKSIFAIIKCPQVQSSFKAKKILPLILKFIHILKIYQNEKRMNGRSKRFAILNPGVWDRGIVPYLFDAVSMYGKYQ